MKYCIFFLMLLLAGCTKEFTEEDKLKVNMERPIRKQADTIPMPIGYYGDDVMPR
jgi:hypothetical protein